MASHLTISRLMKNNTSNPLSLGLVMNSQNYFFFNFYNLIKRGQNNRNLLKEKVKEFALKCRGFHGTMYALETF